MSDETDVPVEGAINEPAPEVSIDDELGAAYDRVFEQANAEETTGQPRGPDGKFIAKDAAPETAAPEATTETTDQGVEKGDEPETPAIEPPVSWSAEAKAEFAKLPPIAQKEILKREADMAKGLEQNATKLKGYEPIEAAIEPVRQHLALNGVEPAQYVRQLVAADVFLRQKPHDAIRWIAQQYGIDLTQTMQPADQDIDPTLAPLVQEINTLKSTITGFQAAQEQAERTRAQAELEAFAKDRPHFEEVRQQMGALIQSGAAKDLPTAYDMAVWANANTRAKLLAEQSAEAERKRKEEAEKKAKDARRISQTNLSSKGTAAGATPVQQNIDEELGAIYDRVKGAA